MLPFHTRLCGFANVISLQDLDDDDVSEMENFVREKLLSYVNGLDSPKINKKDYFGPLYASDTTEFAFLPGDKKLMRNLTAYVKRTIESEKGVGYFNTQFNGNVKEKCGVSQEDIAKVPVLLKKLTETAIQNGSRKKGGFRYDESIKSVSSYLRMLAGPLAYKVMHSNLFGALPSLSSTNRYIHATHSTIVEGVVRSEELLLYLKSRDLPLIVSLAEDATRIVPRIQYNRNTNQLNGFSPPIDPLTGLPIPFSYPARNFSEICQYFMGGYPISEYAIAVMAQPLGDAPPFCLLVFGSDNKFHSDDVHNRWKEIPSELKKVNIEVLTRSSDSEPKYNRAMRILDKLGLPSELGLPEWFSCGATEPPFSVQDTPHIGTKMRNFFLKTKWGRRTLPFGKYFIDINHLQILMRKLPKDQHQLTDTVLNAADRQNFSSVLKMCDKNVIMLLDKHVKRSQGTAKFLEIIRLVIDAFLDVELKPLERVNKLWYSVFMLRIWHENVKSTKGLKMKDNFITTNCYSCIELNAHSLINILLHLRQTNQPQLFLPHLYSSQVCESLFRALRSLSSTFSTIVNCTIKETLERINKIQLQKDIEHAQSAQFVFPKNLEKVKRICHEYVELPTKEQIINTVEDSKRKAITDARSLGLICHLNEKLDCKINPMKMSHERKRLSIPARNFILPSLKSVQLKNFASKFVKQAVDERSPYVEVTRSLKGRVILKKTSLCWLLREESTKLSSDRLQRVKARTLHKQKTKNPFCHGLKKCIKIY